MTDVSTVTVVSSFKLLPGREILWEETYHEIIHKAEQDPASGLRHAHLMRDIRDHDHVVILSEWDSPESFDRFVRDAGLIWDRRGLDFASAPVATTYLERIPAQE